MSEANFLYGKGSAQKWRFFLVALVFFASAFFLSALLGLQPLQWLDSVQTISSRYIDVYPLASALLFVIFYSLVLSCGFPGGALFALLGGFFFGVLQGGALVFLGLAISAAVIRWLVAKSGFVIDRRMSPKLATWFAIRTHKYPFIFPVLIRGIPVLPFFWLNLAFSWIGQPRGPYMVAALLGAAPGVLSLVVIGSGMQTWLADEQISLTLMLTHPLFVASLAMLASMVVVSYCLKRSLSE